ncbi:MAG: FkbM family methyltransferase [Acidobacteriota bacterium]|nr:FkbM family methyltransferase [Acidobacteriota bacterium]
MAAFTTLLMAVALVPLLAGGVAMILFRARRAGLNLHRQIDDVRGDLQAVRAETASLIAGLRDRAEDTNLRLASIQEWIRGKDDAHPRPVLPLPPVAAGLESRGEAELIELAAALAILRPLVPFPCWRHDADLYNPDLSYQLRRWFWVHFNHRRGMAPIVVPWHAGTRLRLFLGNDISAQIYIGGCWEPNELAFLDRILRPGMTFLDAGANEGVYTVFAAARVGAEGCVMSFEPSRRELERLRFNIELNRQNVRVFPVALADAEGRAELRIGGYQHEPHNTLGGFAYEIEAGGTEPVAVRRLDDIVREQAPARIDLLKMDVEGAETRLLQGAGATLRQYRPIVLFEAQEASLKQQGSTREELVSQLRALDYTMYVFDRLTGLPCPAQPCEYDHNMIAAPLERPLPPEAFQPFPVQAGK